MPSWVSHKVQVLLLHNNCVPKINLKLFFLKKDSLNSVGKKLLRARVLDYDDKVVSLTEMSKVKEFNCY